MPSPVGRDEELQRLLSLLTAGHRLVTVSGPPGIGKSTLAVHASAQLRPSFEHGVAVVDLAPLQDPDLLEDAIAREVGVRETTDRSLQAQLRVFLRPRRLLLVLDNMEHLRAAAPMVDDLLNTADRLHILVTSRIALHLSAEAEVALGPLPVPAGRDLAAVTRAPSAALFVTRARQHDPRFALTPDTAETVAEICQRLDGVPLAIELAAARIGTVPLDVLAEQLRRPLGVLAADDAAAVRHPTLREAIAWSDGLLDNRAQRVFYRLAAFAGGCLIEALQAVCADLGTPSEIRDALRMLVDHGLVRMVDEEAARLTLFETMREYGVERLTAVGELDAVRRRHAGWVLQLAERAEPRLQGPEQTVWLRRLDADHENIRTTLQWALETGDAETALRLAGAVWWFWYVRGRFSEGRRWLERAAALSGGPPAARVKVLSGAANLATLQGDVARGGVFAEEAREIAEALGDADGSGHALMNLAMVSLRAKDLDAAAARLEESALRFQRSGNKWGRACALVNLQGLVRRRGDHARASAMLEESVTLLREVGDRMCGASAINALAKQTLTSGDARRAAVLYRESTIYAKDLGSALGIAQALEGLAAAIATAEPEFAATLLGASETAREAGRVVIPPHVQTERDKMKAVVTTALGDASAASAWQAGRRLMPDEAAAFALAGPSAQARRTGTLTPREEQVAALVAQGLTNRQIAEALFITERTAENHVQHIMNKLSVSSRAQIAVWAASRRLGAAT